MFLQDLREKSSEIKRNLNLSIRKGKNKFTNNHIFTTERSVNIPSDEPFTSRLRNLLLAW